MRISIPGLCPEDFDYALACLEDCKQEDAKEFGFNHPFFSPGGQITYSVSDDSVKVICR